MKNHIILSH